MYRQQQDDCSTWLSHSDETQEIRWIFIFIGHGNGTNYSDDIKKKRYLNEGDVSVQFTFELHKAYFSEPF